MMLNHVIKKKIQFSVINIQLITFGEIAIKK